MIIDAPPTKEHEIRAFFVRDFCYKEVNTKFDNTNGDEIAEMFKYKVDWTSVFNNYSSASFDKNYDYFRQHWPTIKTIIGSVILEE